MTTRGLSRHRGLCIAIIGALTLGLQPGGAPADDETGAVGENDRYPCGTLALYALGRLEGCRFRLSEVDRALGGASHADHSMAQLLDGAHLLGFDLEGIRLGTDTFPVDRPVIAHLSRNGDGHFVVLRPIQRSHHEVQVIEPTQGFAVVDYRRLTASPAWTGLGLVRRATRQGAPAGVAELGLVTSGIALSALMRAIRLVKSKVT